MNDENHDKSHSGEFIIPKNLFLLSDLLGTTQSMQIDIKTPGLIDEIQKILIPPEYAAMEIPLLNNEFSGEIDSVLRADQIFASEPFNKTEFWFRGHSQCYNELTPSIFRDPYNREGAPQAEYNLTYQFLSNTGPSIDNPPKNPNKDIYACMKWLFLMQHNDKPTRLLDWTEIYLYALYFCVRDVNDTEGELWAINPRELNKHTGTDGRTMYPQDNPNAIYLSCLPFRDHPSKVLEPFKEQYPEFKEPKNPLAFIPLRDFPRMKAQSSVFTIHPDDPNKREGEQITNLLTFNESIFRYKITNKEDILKQLRIRGINKEMFFPETEHQGNSIKNDIKEKKMRNKKNT